MVRGEPLQPTKFCKIPLRAVRCRANNLPQSGYRGVSQRPDSPEPRKTDSANSLRQCVELYWIDKFDLGCCQRIIAVGSASCALGIPRYPVVARESTAFLPVPGSEEQMRASFANNLRPHLLFARREEAKSASLDIGIAFIVSWSGDMPDRIACQWLAEIDRQVSGTVGIIQSSPLPCRWRVWRHAAHAYTVRRRSDSLVNSRDRHRCREELRWGECNRYLTRSAGSK